jgi:hypothetical protein
MYTRWSSLTLHTAFWFATATATVAGCDGSVSQAEIASEQLAGALAAVSPNSAPIDLAIIGDSPYGADQIPDFPNLVAHVNADSKVRTVVHLGDIKNGSTRCDTSYFQTIAGYFAEFADPLIFTPGDNEWTDCHRANNGAYDPLERLAVLRSIFYPQPDEALGGRKKRLLTQADVPGHGTFVENTMWFESTVAFGVVHAVGSNNGEAAWFTDAPPGTKTDDPVRRRAEVAARTAAAVAWLDDLFALATRENAAGVVVMMQADTWTGGRRDGFTAIVRKLADLSRAFGGPVLLLQGDSHVYKTDMPLAAGDAGYGITVPVPNLTRVVVEGSTTREWLRLSVTPDQTPLFSWERMIR